MLEGLYRMTGDLENAAMAADHVATLKASAAEVVAATVTFRDGDLGPAESIIRPFLIRTAIIRMRCGFWRGSESRARPR